ncbi:MAG: gliding motility protein GldM [Bacteroidota bacterium]|jgi:gliding motility-associated protein GldM
MAGGKETPRQKMIGMMYLVLTALLALNVSKEILNSFILINDSLVVTNKNFANKNQSQYDAFKAALLNDQKKVQPWYDNALAVKASADDMVSHIEDLKRYLIMRTDGLDSNEVNIHLENLAKAANDEQREPHQLIIDSIFSLKNVNSKDNYDIPTNIMIGGQEGQLKEGPHTASELVQKLNDFRDKMVSMIDPKKGQSIIDALKTNFNTDTTLQISQSEKEPWAYANFYHIPLAAVVTNLSKIQTDVRNAESDVVKYLFREVDASDFKFDTLAAKIIAPNLVFMGDEYKAEIFVAAFSTTQNPVVAIGNVDETTGKLIGNGDTTSVKVDRGVGMYTVRASSEGLKKYEGVIKVKAPSGQILGYPFQGEYMVMKSGVVVSPTKMNVLYRGVKNPISISVPGIAPELVKPSLEGGTLRPDAAAGKGNYIAEVAGGSTAKVIVSAEVEGKQRKMGEFEFRVKDVPPPVATIAGVEEGLISANRLTAAPTVIPKMQNFDFELFFKVTKFDLVYQVGTDLITTNVNGSSIPANALSQIARLKKGSRIYIENISAVMLDENNRPAEGVTPKKLSPVSLKLN